MLVQREESESDIDLETMLAIKVMRAKGIDLDCSR